MTDEEDIQYVDASDPQANFYSSNTGKVVLDEKLKEYPLAHEYVRSHELNHSSNDGVLWKELLTEFKNDLYMYSSSSEEAQEIRQYVADCRTISPRETFKGLVLNSLRGLWIPWIAAVGKIWRIVVTRRNGNR